MPLGSFLRDVQEAVDENKERQRAIEAETAKSRQKFRRR